MIHHIWFLMMAISIIYGCVQEGGKGVLEAALGGCGNAVSLTLELCGGYMFFCGLMEIAAALRAEKGLTNLFSPVMKKLLPNIRTQETSRAVTLNLAMNVLGMGNAATPAGLEAMRCMEAEHCLRPAVSHDMEMFLILNATSLQLLPTTVLTLRTAAGSSDANAILLPTILCTAFSTITGIACGLICRFVEEQKHGN